MPEIETFENRVNRQYNIHFEAPEFTSVCPITGLPDFGTIIVDYTPGDRCLELKSFKYYLMSFRNRGIFYEDVTNQILDDIVAACEPLRAKVVGDFHPRGGIRAVVTAEWERSPSEGV